MERQENQQGSGGSEYHAEEIRLLSSLYRSLQAATTNCSVRKSEKPHMKSSAIGWGSMSLKESWRQRSWECWQKWRLVSHMYLKGRYKESRGRLFSATHSGRMIGSGHRLEHRRFLNCRKHFFCCEGDQEVAQISRNVVESLFLQMFRSCLDTDQGHSCKLLFHESMWKWYSLEKGKWQSSQTRHFLQRVGITTALRRAAYK